MKPKTTDLTNDEMYKKFQDSLHAGFACLTDAIVAFAFQIQRETRGIMAGENRRLREALQGLYDKTADYIRINNLGDVHHNQTMKKAEAALSGEPVPQAAVSPQDREE